MDYKTGGEGVNRIRRYGGNVYEYYCRYGGRDSDSEESKTNANITASELRTKGCLARVTLERQDHGVWWVVWKGVISEDQNMRNA